MLATKIKGQTERNTVSTSSKRQPDLEKSLAELEKIVAELEEGDIPLEQALKQFEKGVKSWWRFLIGIRKAHGWLKLSPKGGIING